MSIFNKYKYKNQYIKLLIACYVFYVFSSAIRLVYGVQLVTLETNFQTTKSKVALGLTIFYLSYAVSQIILSFFISKINLKHLLLISTILSATSFAFIGITTQLWQVWLILALNGIFQASGWGGITYILGKHLPNDTLPSAVRFLGTGYFVGNALSFLVSAICVALFSWKATYDVFAVLFFASIIYLVYEEIKTEKVTANNDEFSFENVTHSSHEYVIPKGVKFNLKVIMFYVCLLLFLINIINYGISDWIPTLLYEEHKFPQSLSILVSVIMPIATLPAAIIMTKIFDKHNKIFTISTFVGIVLFALLFIMIFGYSIGLVFAVIMSVLLKFIQNCYATGYSTYTLFKFKNYINTGTSNLIANGIVCFAGGVVPLFVGLIIDEFGWQIYYVFLTSLCLLTIILSIIGDVIIKKKNRVSTWL